MLDKDIDMSGFWCEFKKNLDHAVYIVIRLIIHDPTLSCQVHRRAGKELCEAMGASRCAVKHNEQHLEQ